MNHNKKTNHKKSSLSTSSSSSSCSSENNHWQNIEQSSIRRPIYPNVPKRSQRSSFIHDHETIQTESRIDIIPSEQYSENSNEYLSMPSSSNQNPYIRHTLDLITKYTSPQKKLQESLSVIHSISSNTQSINESKSKRTLSPVDETNHESKRTKSFDDDDDEDELSQFLDHRLSKQNLSQDSNTIISFQSQTDIEQNKSTTRKPTFRKLSTSQQKPTLSQPKPVETLPIEIDIETEEENLISQTEARWLSTRSQLPNVHHNVNKESKDTNQAIPTPIIPSPIKLPIENCMESLHSTPTKLPIDSLNSTPIRHHTPTHSSKQTREHLMNNLSPCLNNENGGRRFSTSSSLNSLVFDTPNTSFSRTTIDNTTSTPRNSIKNDCETQIIFPSNLDMINQLILQMNINSNDNDNKIDYDPIEISKKFFHQCISLTNNTYLTMDLLIKKQFLHFGRYEIEISFPINHDKNSTIYACDVCLKHFHGSSIAFQRHTSKCLYTQPPGKFVFNKDDLAIFEIGQIPINMEQRIYIKSLCRIVRLFIDPNKNIDDTKIDKFTYYILCRRDPVLSQFQSSIYHFVGYFSKEHNQQIQQQSINNLSCLFILPPFVQHQQYNQCLITFSYSLIRSNDSANLMYSSPARPLDNLTLFAFRNYWRNILFAYIINHNYSSIKSLALDIFARQTSIHPRDILSSLYSNGSIVPHPTDKSYVYLLNKAYHSMTSLNLHTRTKFLFMDMDLINNDDKKKTMHDNLNTDKSLDSGIEEIILD